jgi:hypothetical protein
MKKYLLFLSAFLAISLTMNSTVQCSEFRKVAQFPLTLLGCGYSYLLGAGCSIFINMKCANNTVADKASMTLLETFLAPFNSVDGILQEIRSASRTMGMKTIAKNIVRPAVPAIIGFGLIPMAVHKNLQDSSKQNIE